MSLRDLASTFGAANPIDRLLAAMKKKQPQVSIDEPLDLEPDDRKLERLDNAAMSALEAMGVEVQPFSAGPGPEGPNLQGTRFTEKGWMPGNPELPGMQGALDSMYESAEGDPEQVDELQSAIRQRKGTPLGLKHVGHGRFTSYAGDNTPGLMEGLRAWLEKRNQIMVGK